MSPIGAVYKRNNMVVELSLVGLHISYALAKKKRHLFFHENMYHLSSSRTIYDNFL